MNPSTAQRKVIYGVVALATAALLAFDVMSAGEINLTIENINQLVASIVSGLAYVNTNPEVGE